MMTSPVVLEQGLKRPAFFFTELKVIYKEVIITFINLADKGIRKAVLSLSTPRKSPCPGPIRGLQDGFLN
jgi:hypothetical protein